MDMNNASSRRISLKDALEFVVDNRGKTAPTATTGHILIATNCISNDQLYPSYVNVRYVSDETYQNWFRAHPQPGDIILTNKGSQNGAICLVPPKVDFCIAQDMMALRADQSKIDSLYLFAALRSAPIQQAIKSLNVDGVIPHFKKTDFDKLTISLPDRDQQEKIGQLHFAIVNKIELNRRMNETLEAMSRALFRDWFVDFGPTRAKMEGQAPYLSPALWDLFPATLDDEGKPEGWKVKPLSDAFDLLMGQSPPGDTYNDDGDGLPFFQGRTDFGFRFPENRKYCSAPARIAEKGDTLVSVRAPVGDINIAAERCCIGRGVAALRHKDDRPSFTYCTAWALQEELRQYENTGTVFGAINRKQFEALPTVDAGSDLLKAFEETASAMDQQIERNEREARTLAQTRDLLLPRLMSGQLRVSDLPQKEVVTPAV
jgi:type I restriction enzyme S subunit